MAKSTQNNSRRVPARLEQSSQIANIPTTPSSPPSHPPLQYEDEQRFRTYAHSLDFEIDDFSTDHMFEHPMPLPQPKLSKIISAAELQRRVQDSQPARGTGLGKTNYRPRKRVRFNTPCADDGESRVDSVRESPDGSGPAKRRCSINERIVQAEDPGNDDEESSGDCAWSVDLEVEGGDEGERGKQINASSKHDSSFVKKREQQGVEAGDTSGPQGGKATGRVN